MLWCHLCCEKYIVVVLEKYKQCRCDAREININMALVECIQRWWCGMLETCMHRYYDVFSVTAIDLL